MEAFKTIAKRIKTGKYKIELRNISDKEEVDVIVVVPSKKNKVSALSEPTGKMKN